MEKLIKVKEKGMKVINPSMRNEWETFCHAIYNKCGLREVGVEIIEDAIETMRLLKETSMGVEDVIKTVGRSWQGRISSLILLGAIEKFSLEGNRFKEELNDLKQQKKSKSLDDILKMKR